MKYTCSSWFCVFMTKKQQMKNLSEADEEAKPQIVPFAYDEISDVCYIYIYSFLLAIAVEL